MKAFLLTISFLCSLTLLGQVVNIEKKRPKAATTGWQGDADFSLNITQNTNKIIQGKNALKMQHYKDRNTYLLFNDISIMHLNDNKLINSGFMHLRYNYEFEDSIIIAEAFTQIQYNTIQKLQRRFLWGGGLRFRVTDKKNIRIYLGTSLMYEFELLRLKDENNVYQEVPNDNIRINVYLTAQYFHNNLFSVSHTTYHQPNITTIDDYRISSETSINYKLSNKLTFRLFYFLLYDSDPPQDVPTTFYSLNNGIRYSF